MELEARRRATARLIGQGVLDQTLTLVGSSSGFIRGGASIVWGWLRSEETDAQEERCESQ